MSVAATLALAWNLLTVSHGSGLRQVAASAPLLGLNLWAAYGLSRVAAAQEASVGPYLYLTKHQQPSMRRGFMFVVFALCIAFSALVAT